MSPRPKHAAASLIGVLLVGCASMPDASAIRPGHEGATPAAIPGVGNFAQVSPVLYRGEQPTPAGYAELKRRGVKTIVNLRMHHDDGGPALAAGLDDLHLRTDPWSIGETDLRTFLRIVEDPACQPVFVHCKHGADRTGAAVATYRVVEQGWTANEAIAEMYRFGFHRIFTNIPTYVRGLERRAAATRPTVVAAVAMR